MVFDSNNIQRPISFPSAASRRSTIEMFDPLSSPIQSKENRINNDIRNDIGHTVALASSHKQGREESLHRNRLWTESLTDDDSSMEHRICNRKSVAATPPRADSTIKTNNDSIINDNSTNQQIDHPPPPVRRMKKKTWSRILGRHRKSKSELPSALDGLFVIDPDSASTTSTPSTPVMHKVTSSDTYAPTTKLVTSSSLPASLPSSSSTPMVNDLMTILQNTELCRAESADIPSLAKPRPTSFLIGNETFRSSSEKSATAWQLGIPSKDEFQVCIRACQFMETYNEDGEGHASPSNEDFDLHSIVDCDLTGTGSATDSSVSSDQKRKKIIQSIRGCGNDVIKVRGYNSFTVTEQNDNNESDNDSNSNSSIHRKKMIPKDGNDNILDSNRREVLILERQQQFLCVFRGTDAEQRTGQPSSSSLSSTTSDDTASTSTSTTITLEDSGYVKVFKDQYDAFHDIESMIFKKLDDLADESPFCDVIFTGHSFGGSCATLAAYRYSSGRPELRVAALVTESSTPVGLDDFRSAVHACPNLKVMRIEYEDNKNNKNSSIDNNDNGIQRSNNKNSPGRKKTKKQQQQVDSSIDHHYHHHQFIRDGGKHVGHTIQIRTATAEDEEEDSFTTATTVVVAYRFGNGDDRIQHKQQQEQKQEKEQDTPATLPTPPKKTLHISKVPKFHFMSSSSKKKQKQQQPSSRAGVGGHERQDGVTITTIKEYVKMFDNLSTGNWVKDFCNHDMGRDRGGLLQNNKNNSNDN